MATTIVAVALALLVSAVLVVLTSVLHRTTTSAVASVEGVRLAQEAEIDLLLHGRATDALVRRDLQESLRRRFADARRFVTSDTEATAIEEAEAAVTAYIRANRDQDLTAAEITRRQEAAFGALEALVTINLAQARAAYSTATSWDRRANILGIGVAALLLVAATGVLVWIERSAFAPVIALAAAMKRFGRGERGARVDETGPSELRAIGRTFNEMAGALASQRDSQIAFLAGVAHDLRNPLSALKTSMALLRPDRPLPPEERLRRMIATVARQITRLERMTGDFLDFARIEAGDLDLRLDLHDARELARNVVELLEDATPGRRILLLMPDQAVALVCDHVRIEQVLTNLVSNALKYSPPGSPVEVAVEPGDRHVAFRVTDRGVGIPEGDRERVFDPFRRVGPSGKSVPGVGLGLAVVRRIVEAHAGRIELESTAGTGSTFRVFLPVRTQAA